MDENISIKHAVYIDKDGDDVLEVVRDTLDEAKADMERLKKETSYIRIEKANIKNFGKDDEKVIDSETITSWDSADGKSRDDDDESLSDHYKASGNADSDNGQSNQVGTSPVVATPPADALTEPKKITWQEHYAKHGALIWGDGWEELTKAKVKSESDIKSESTTTPAPDSTTVATPAPEGDKNAIEGNGAGASMPTPPIIEPKKDNTVISLSDADVDKIAEKLKDKLSQNGVQSQVKSEPQKTIS